MSQAFASAGRSLGALARWAAVIRGRMVESPFQVAVSAMAIPIGVVAIVLGAEVSEAMTRVLGNVPEVVRLWGAWVAVSGAAALAGRYGGRPWLERAGLRTLGPAYALYAVCVLLGLGHGGLVTGPMFLALAISCFVRARLSLRSEAARRVAEKILNSGRRSP
jgi:hypothetical protein